MALIAFNGKIEGGGNIPLLGKLIQELRGLTVSTVAGAGTGTLVQIPKIRQEDTILSVVQSNAGVLTDVTANYTISSVKSYGNVIVSTGTVVDGSNVVIGGVTFTARTNPVLPTDFKLQATRELNAQALTAAINAYKTHYDGSKWVPFNVVSFTGVSGGAAYRCALTATIEGPAGNSIALVGGTGLAVSNTTLLGGTDTGAIMSNVDHSGTSLLVTWFDKNP